MEIQPHTTFRKRLVFRISFTECAGFSTECARHVFSKYYSVIIQINSDIVVHVIKTAVYDTF